MGVWNNQNIKQYSNFCFQCIMFGYRYLGYLGNQGKFFQYTPHFISQIKKLQMATILNLVSEFPIF